MLSFIIPFKKDNRFSSLFAILLQCSFISIQQLRILNKITSKMTKLQGPVWGGGGGGDVTTALTFDHNIHTCRCISFSSICEWSMISLLSFYVTTKYRSHMSVSPLPLDVKIYKYLYLSSICVWSVKNVRYKLLSYPITTKRGRICQTDGRKDKVITIGLLHLWWQGPKKFIINTIDTHVHPNKRRTKDNITFSLKSHNRLD